LKRFLKVVPILVFAASIQQVGATSIGTGAFSSSAALINFDDLPGDSCSGCGTPITNQYSLFGVTFDDPSFPGGATLQTNFIGVLPNASGPNVLVVRQGGLITDPAAIPLRLNFSSAMNRVGFNFFTSSASYLLLEAFNGSQLLDSVIFSGSANAFGVGGFAGLQTQPGMTRLEISAHPVSDPTRTLNFAVDNLLFESAPEPSSLLLGLAGLVGIAWKRLSSSGSRR
jgi:hypothetical protein